MATTKSKKKKKKTLKKVKIKKKVHKFKIAPEDCTSIAWGPGKAIFDNDDNPICPHCGAPAEMGLFIMGEGYHHIPSTEEKEDDE